MSQNGMIEKQKYAQFNIFHCQNWIKEKSMHKEIKYKKKRNIKRANGRIWFFCLTVEHSYHKTLNTILRSTAMPPPYFLGARGVVIIVVGNEHGDTGSNPGRDWLHFT